MSVSPVGKAHASRWRSPRWGAGFLQTEGADATGDRCHGDFAARIRLRVLPALDASKAALDKGQPASVIIREDVAKDEFEVIELSDEDTVGLRKPISISRSKVT